MIRPRPAGDGYTAQNTTLKLMISVAYRIPKNQITGGPDWMDTEHYNLEAKADHAYGLEDLHIMLQHLLAERFHLVFHKETREGPVYALVVDASGVKMTPDGDQPDLNIPIGLPNHGVFTGTKVSMAYLCYWLGLQVPGDRQRPVIDRTGLRQVYDFKLSFVPDLPPNMTREQLPPELQNLPFLPDALREQLGLRLEAQKGPVEYYVLDKAEKPTPN